MTTSTTRDERKSRAMTVATLSCGCRAKADTNWEGNWEAWIDQADDCDRKHSFLHALLDAWMANRHGF